MTDLIWNRKFSADMDTFSWGPKGRSRISSPSQRSRSSLASRSTPAVRRLEASDGRLCPELSAERRRCSLAGSCWLVYVRVDQAHFAGGIDIKQYTGVPANPDTPELVAGVVVGLVCPQRCRKRLVWVDDDAADVDLLCAANSATARRAAASATTTTFSMTCLLLTTLPPLRAVNYG